MSDIILYTSDDGQTRMQLRVEGKTVWLSQLEIAELFQVAVPTVNEHLKGIYDEGELEATPTIREFRIVQTEGTRQVERTVKQYNLDVILAHEKVRESGGLLMQKRATLLPQLSGSVSESRAQLSTAGLALPNRIAISVPAIDIPFAVKAAGFSDAQLRKFGIPTEGATTSPAKVFDAGLVYPQRTDPFDLFAAQASVSVPVLDLPSVEKYRASRAEETKSILAVAKAEEDTMAQAATLYFNVLADLEQESALKMAAQLAANKQDVVRDQFASGKVKALEVLKGELVVFQASNNLKQAQTQLHNAQRNFRIQLNLPEDQPLELTDPLVYVPVIPEPVEKVIAFAITNRLDFQMQKLDELSSLHNLQAAKDAWWPTVKASGNYGKQGHEADDTEDTWFVGISANIPIWDSFQRRGRLREMDSLVEQNRNRTANTVLTIESELRAALDQLDFAADSEILAIESVKVSAASYEDAQSQERAGKAKEIDLATAGSALAQAEYQQAASAFQYNQTLVSWYKALGDVTRILPVIAHARAKRAAELLERPPTNPVVPKVPLKL